MPQPSDRESSNSDPESSFPVGHGPPPIFLEHPPELLVLDVDGVLTDNTIWLDANGAEQKRFFVPDGTGIRRIQRAGVPVALVSGRKSGVVDARAKELGIEHAYSGVIEKTPRVEAIIAATGVRADRTVYMGDDWIDLDPMGAVGLPVAVANAIREVKEIAIAVTTIPGGFGAVREVCDWILLARS